MEKLDQERKRIAEAVSWAHKVRERLLQQGGSLTLSDIEEIEKELRETLFVVSDEATQVEKMSIYQLALRRAIPLSITAIIGLGVASVIQSFEGVLRQYALLVAFAPLVSGVSGNFGLQTATVIIRALAVMSFQGVAKALLRELFVGLLCNLLVGSLAGMVAWLTTGYWQAFLVLYISLAAGMLTSALMGTVIPLIFHRIGVDPALVAGPFETSLQDLASYGVFLATTLLLLPP